MVYMVLIFTIIIFVYRLILQDNVMNFFIHTYIHIYIYIYIYILYIYYIYTTLNYTNLLH